MIPSLAQVSSTRSPLPIYFIWIANGGHYICPLHVTKDFLHPNCLVEKGLNEPYFLLASHRQIISQATPETPSPSDFDVFANEPAQCPVRDSQGTWARRLDFESRMRVEDLNLPMIFLRRFAGTATDRPLYLTQ